MPTPIIYNVSDLFDKDDKIASSLFVDNNIIGNNDQTQLRQASQSATTQQSQQSSLPPGILAEITGDYRNYYPKPPKPDPTWGEKYLGFMNDTLGAASPYATQFVSGALLGYSPVQPLPENANTFEKIGAAAANLGGMGVNMAVLPYGEVAGWMGRVLEGSRLPTEFISQLMGKSNAVAQGVKTFGEGMLYGAAEHKKSPEESRLWNAMTTGGTFALFGLSGGAMEDVGKYVSPTIRRVFNKIKNEEPLTKPEEKILKVVQAGEAIVLGAAGGATQPAKDIGELAQNIIVGAGSFGVVHGVTRALSRIKKKDTLTEEETNFPNAEPADNPPDFGISAAEWEAIMPKESLTPIDNAQSSEQALREFEKINTDTLNSLDVPFDVRANKLAQDLKLAQDEVKEEQPRPPIQPDTDALRREYRNKGFADERGDVEKPRVESADFEEYLDDMGIIPTAEEQAWADDIADQQGQAAEDAVWDKERKEIKRQREVKLVKNELDLLSSKNKLSKIDEDRKAALDARLNEIEIKRDLVSERLRKNDLAMRRLLAQEKPGLLNTEQPRPPIEEPKSQEKEGESVNEHDIEMLRTGNLEDRANLNRKYKPDIVLALIAQIHEQEQDKILGIEPKRISLSEAKKEAEKMRIENDKKREKYFEEDKRSAIEEKNKLAEAKKNGRDKKRTSKEKEVKSPVQIEASALSAFLDMNELPGGGYAINLFAPHEIKSFNDANIVYTNPDGVKVVDAGALWEAIKKVESLPISERNRLVEESRAKMFMQDGVKDGIKNKNKKAEQQSVSETNILKGKEAAVLEDYPGLREEVEKESKIEKAKKETPEPQPTAEGKEVTVHVTPGTPIKIKYDVVEAKDLRTSHDINGNVNEDFPKELQPRDRSRTGSILQVNKISQTLNPELLGEAPDAGHGAPIVSPDSNNVEIGHGRTLAIQSAYEKGKRGTEYKKRLEDNAEKYGPLKEKINSMEQPILIRRRISNVEDLSDYVQKANESDMAKMSITEQAVVDAENLSSDDIAMFRPDQNGNLMAATNKGFIDLFIDKMSPEEQAGYITEDGRANKQLIDRVQAAVFQKAYRSDELLKLSAEEANPDIKNILNGLTSAVPNFVKARGLDENLADTGIIEDIVNGIELLRMANKEFHDIKAGNGRTALQARLRQSIDQGDIFGNNPSEDVINIAQFLSDNIRSGKRIGEFFDSMGVRIKSYIADLAQAEMFDAKKKLTSKDLINLSKEFLNEKYEDKQRSLFEKPPKQKGSPKNEAVNNQGSNERRDEDPGEKKSSEETNNKPWEMSKAEYVEKYKYFDRQKRYPDEINAVNRGYQAAHYGAIRDDDAINQAKKLKGLKVYENLTRSGDYLVVQDTPKGKEVAQKLINLSQKRKALFISKDIDAIDEWNFEFSTLLGYEPRLANSIRDISGRGDSELDAERFHKYEIQQALDSGKAVPDSVLKDYPDLISASVPEDLKEEISKTIHPDAQRNLKIDIHNSSKDIKDTHPIFSKNDDIVGAYDPGTGRISLFADKINKDEVHSIVMHETVHMARDKGGWRAVFGKDADKILEQIKRNIKDGTKDEWIQAQEQARDAETPKEDLLEETISYFLQKRDNTKTGTFQKIKRAIAGFLYQAGIKTEVTDDVIHNMADRMLKDRANGRSIDRNSTAKAIKFAKKKAKETEDRILQDEDDVFTRVKDFISGNKKFLGEKAIGEKKDLNLVEHVFGTTMFNAEHQGGAYERLYKNVLNKTPEHKLLKQNELRSEGDYSLFEPSVTLKKKHPSLYGRVMRDIIKKDIDAYGYTVKKNEDTELYEIYDPEGKQASEPMMSFDKAYRTAFELEAENSKLTDPEKEVLINHRKMVLKLYHHYADAMNEIIRQHEFAGVEVPKVTIIKKGKPVKISLKTAMMKMGNRVGYYFPRIRESGDWKIEATKKGVPSEVKFFKTKFGARQYKAQMIRRGYKTIFSETGTLSEDIYQTLAPLLAQEQVINKTLGKMSTGDDFDVNMADLFVKQYAAVIKSHGSRSRMIGRSDAVGMNVKRGYETDLVRAMAGATDAAAGGWAKQQAAINGLRTITGKDLTYPDYLVDNPDATYKDYLKATKERGIDASKEHRAYREATAALRDVLKNNEFADNVIASLKSAAVVKYLGGRVSSAAFNMTNMVLGVPGALAGELEISIPKAFKAIGSAGKEYLSHRLNKKTQLTPLFKEIERRGLDTPQFNQEAVEALQTRTEGAYRWIVDKSMYMFGVTEKINRAWTIAANYKAIAKKAGKPLFKKGEVNEEWLNQAEDISNHAHGKYGKANQMYVSRGNNVGAQTLQAYSVFMTFSQTYLQEMARLGLVKKQYGPALYMALSGALIGGVGATVPMSIAKAIAKLFNTDDPEEAMIKALGGSDFVRYGLSGVLGISTKGTLAMRFEPPEKIIDLFGAPGGLVEDVFYGLKNISQGFYEQGAEKILPTAIGSLLKALRERNQGVTTRSGSPVFFGNKQIKANDYDTLLRFFSFNPTNIDKKKAILHSEYSLKRRYNEYKGELNKRYKMLYLISPGNRDRNDLINLYADIRDFNKELRDKGITDIVSPITLKTLYSTLKRALRPSKRERLRKED